MKKSNIIIGIILLALSAFYYYSTRELPPPTKTENLGSAFFPILLAIVLAFLSLMLIINTFLFRSASDHEEEKAAIDGGERLEEDSFSAERISYKFLIGTMGMSTLYIILLPIIGYLIVTPFFLFGLIRFLGMERWLNNIAVSIGLTAVLYLLFARMLGVPLPGGIFFS
ncbi:MAG: tripartite tricarboxylate transporter TctB family protein [Thermodesulfobacteriota bacterium]|nr:tripartite tricarboxylate transporter TctB family protein [Thermodesulfobacteriota bacterium]